MTQKEKYLQWFKEAKETKGLIDVKFYAGDIKLSSQEEYYREANHFNEQLDRADIKPLYSTKS